MASFDIDPKVAALAILGVGGIYYLTLRKTGSGVKYLAERGRGGYRDVKRAYGTGYRDVKRQLGGSKRYVKSAITKTVGSKGVLGWFKRRF